MKRIVGQTSDVSRVVAAVRRRCRSGTIRAPLVVMLSYFLCIQLVCDAPSRPRLSVSTHSFCRIEVEEHTYHKSVEGSIFTLSAIILLIVQVGAAYFSHTCQLRHILKAALATGFWSVILVVMLWLMVSNWPQYYGWIIVYCMFIPAVNISATLMQAMVISATSPENRSHIAWLTAVYQMAGSLLGAFLSSFLEKAALFPTATFMMLVLLLVSGRTAIHEVARLSRSQSETVSVTDQPPRLFRHHAYRTSPAHTLSSFLQRCLLSANSSYLLAFHFCSQWGLAINCLVAQHVWHQTNSSRAPLPERWAFTIEAVVAMLASYIATRTSDAVGRKPVIVLSLSLSSLLSMLLLCWPRMAGVAGGCAMASTATVLLAITQGIGTSVTLAFMMDSMYGHVSSPSTHAPAPSVVPMLLLWRGVGAGGAVFADLTFELCALRDDATPWVACAVSISCCIASAACISFTRVEDEPAERITVTGGFFDQSPNAYIGLITVWRARKYPCIRQSQHKQVVTRLTFRFIKEYSPSRYPVLNKGFAGGSWHGNELFVCWPNRIAVIKPQFGDWSISHHIDDEKFNDLHHVDANDGGVWVANTGFESVDRFDYGGALIGRQRFVTESAANRHAEGDIRGQDAHTIRRGKDEYHINHVWAEPGKSDRVLATCLHVGRVVSLTFHEDRAARATTIPKPTRVATFSSGTRPHEGFLATASAFYARPLLWNSTVDGRVLASHPETGKVYREWRLTEYDIPRGWTRGLCLCKDGFLVGATTVRGEAVHWLKWNFEPAASCTSVVFVPWNSDVTRRKFLPRVTFLTSRCAKIFSLLHTPHDVDISSIS